MVTCGFCGHPGTHATIIEGPGAPTRCCGCPHCEAEAAAERAAAKRASHLHLLPVGSMLPRAPEGYVTRRRTAIEGADLDALDAEVEAAGGHVVRHTIESKSLGRGRTAPRVQDASWYVIPTEAVED